jgi:glutaredoxin 3
MSTKRNIEVFSAGCFACEETIALVSSIACGSCEITVHDTRQEEGANRAKELGIRSFPAVVVDGQLASCCAGRGVDQSALQAAGVGSPIP